MPIYAYKCAACGFAKDVLQKISDAPLTQCPSCHAEAFSKQVTAAGFQLKGSGWYVTDFRDGNKGKEKSAGGGASDASTAGDGAGADAAAPKSDTAKSESPKAEPAAAKKADAAPAATSPASTGSAG